MRNGLAVAALAGAATAVGLRALRLSDLRHERIAWAQLARRTSGPDQAFDPALVSGLPDPARRYFLFAIAPGTRLSRVAELEMTGALSLGTKQQPNYMPMHARQILAGPSGFVWRVHAGARAMWFTGSDGYAEGRG